MVGGEALLVEGHEFGEIGRELLAAAGAERPHGIAIAAGGAAEAKIDAAGMEGFEGAIGLGDAQRRVVEQHDAARADAQRGGGRAALAIRISGTEEAMEGMP